MWGMHGGNNKAKRSLRTATGKPSLRNGVLSFGGFRHSVGTIAEIREEGHLSRRGAELPDSRKRR